MVRVALRAPGVRTTGALPRRKPAMAAIVLRGLAVLAFSWLGLSGCAPREAPARLAVAAGDDSRPGIAGLLRGDDAGFARAQRRREFSFPADHGAHPAFRTEWWYVTGHLAGDDGRRFGFQFTVFRQALAPPATPAPREPSGARVLAPASAWRAQEAWLAHLALTDIAARQHWAAARLTRGALGLAGATASPMAVWVEDWRFAQPTAAAPMVLRARDATGIALELELTPMAAPVLHGEGGLSRKGERAASYYYSMPHWRVRGRVGSPARPTPVTVTGTAWLDREWSTSALTPQQIGWDWFALRLGDGRALMLFQLRHGDGRRDQYDAGSLIARDGSVQHLTGADFTLVPGRAWRDEQGVPWPVSWSLNLHPARQPPLQLSVAAEVDDQLMRVGLRYWEGAVHVTGDANGEGYLEMTGYRSGSQR